MSTPVQQIDLTRQDLIKSSLKLRDENEELRSRIEKPQGNVAARTEASLQMEHELKFWRTTGLLTGSVLLALLIVMVGYVWGGA